jgi:hypothetical protein
VAQGVGLDFKPLQKKKKKSQKSIYLASAEPWVPSPVLPKKGKVIPEDFPVGLGFYAQLGPPDSSVFFSP